MIPRGELIAVARVAKLFGAEGSLSLNLLEAFPGTFDTSEPLFLLWDGLAVPLFLDRFERRGQRGATVRFADIDTQRRASELVGRELYRRLDAQPLADIEESPDGEVYLEEMVGWRTLFENGLEGEIAEFVDGENPLFRVMVTGREVWIPAVEELIAEVDPDARTIAFDLPEGLLELYLE